MKEIRVDSVLEVVAHYERSLEENILAGKYENVDHVFYSHNHFGITRGDALHISVSLIAVSPELSNWKIRKLLDEMGLRFADLAVLLAVGDQHPNEQNKYMIAAMGDTAYFFCEEYVPCLDSENGIRKLILYGNGKDNETWSETTRLAAVPKRA